MKKKSVTIASALVISILCGSSYLYVQNDNAKGLVDKSITPL